MSATRRLPAFAKDLADARRRGYTLRNPFVTVRLSWGRRPRYGFGVIVPNDVAPQALDWSWVSNLEVIVYWRFEQPDRVRAAVRAILAARPRRLSVLMWSNDDSTVTIIREEIHATFA